MKKFLLLFTMLAGLRSYGKTPINHTNDPRLLMNRATEDKEAIVIPGGSTPSFPSYLPADRYDRALYMKTGGSDQGLYRWNGSAWVYAVPPPDLSNYMTLSGTQTITGVKNFGSVNFLGNITFANGQTVNLGQAVLFGKWLMADNSGYLGAAPYTPADDGNVLKLTGVANQVVVGNVRYDGFMRSQSAGRYSEILGTTWQIAAGNYINLSGGTSTNDIEIATASGRDILLKPFGGDTYKITSTGIIRVSDGASPVWKAAGGGVGITGDFSFTGTNFYLGSSVAPNNGGLFYGVAGYMTQTDYLKYNSQFGGYLGVGDASAQTGAAVASFNSSSHTGLQLPYMTSAQRLAINTSSGDNTALLAYQTNGTKGLYILTDPNSSSYWRRFLTEDNATAYGYQSTASDGTGGLVIASQTTRPSTPAANTARIFFDSDGLSWLTSTGFKRSFYGGSLTADRQYTLPDASGTLQLTSDALSYTRLASIPAHTIMANTGNSTGGATAITYYDSGEQTFTGTITWTGTTAPSGTTNHTYQWTRVGNQVTLRVLLIYSVAGTALTQVDINMPADVPRPHAAAGMTVNNPTFLGYGGLSTDAATSPTTAGRAKIRYTGGIVQVTGLHASGNWGVAHYTIIYFTD